ncbi:hypothetical protein LMG28688_07271 [Paraburkholderia caffeinitolerans]|uniref:Uncharacterized protein n=1 Tax=Paraburkholderia caffeinitolerans TaxID=1723730 RepID=A0A6J5H3Y6_9BURK|nr:hypothetical protein LMG28688_07271 [Paraburkholderia caffeinitolerans]
MPSSASPPAWLAGFKLPGYRGENRSRDDSIIADPATQLDPSMKAGALVNPLPDAKGVNDLVTTIIPDQVKGLVDYITTAVNGGDGTGNSTADAQTFEKSLVNLPPGERVAQVKQTAQTVAADNGWQKDSQLSRINGRDVYRTDDGTLYAVDSQHGRFEQINAKTGEHMGEVSMIGLQPTKPADTSGRHDLRLK